MKKIKKPEFKRGNIPANIIFATNIINLNSRIKARAVPFNVEGEKRLSDEELGIWETILENMNAEVLSKIDLSKYDGVKCTKASDNSIKHLKNLTESIGFYRWLKYTLNACADGFGAWSNVDISDRAIVIDIINKGMHEYGDWVVKQAEFYANKREEEFNGQ